MIIKVLPAGCIAQLVLNNFYIKYDCSSRKRMKIVRCFRIILRLAIVLTNNREKFFILNLIHFYNSIIELDQKIQIEKFGINIENYSM